MQFEKVSLADVIVVVALSLALMLAIFYKQNELSMSIASGLLGYNGGATKSAVQKKEE